MDKAVEFTQLFLEVIETLRQEQNRTHSDIARAAFPSQKDPVGTYRKIRNSGQNLRLQDAYRLVTATHQDFAATCWKVTQAMSSS